MVVLGVDIGGTKVAAAAVHEDGSITDRVSRPTPKSPDGILKAVEALFYDVKRIHGDALQAIGIGAAGQVNVNEGKITYAVDTIPGWRGTALKAPLESDLGVPVVVENDVNALALGEFHFGAGSRYHSSLFVAVGTGIGGALVTDGKLWHGARWSAGELGHILVDWQSQRRCTCGQHGHLEVYAAGPAMTYDYFQRIGQEPAHTDLRQVVALAEQGDDHALAAIQQGAHILGLALAGIVNTFDPDVLIVGGGVAEIGAMWWSPLEDTLHAGHMPAPRHVVVQRAQLGGDATIVGAGYMAHQYLHGNTA